MQAQAASTIATGNRKTAYEWRRAVQEGKEWKDWNAEQQAMAMQDYFDADQRIEAAKAAGSSPAPDVEIVNTLEWCRGKVRSGKGAPGGPSDELDDFVLPQDGERVSRDGLRPLLTEARNLGSTDGVETLALSMT